MIRIDSRSQGDAPAREARDSEGSGVEFKRQLDAAKPKQPAKPQPKKSPQDDASQPDPQAQVQAEAQAQAQPLLPRSFTDLGDAITRALTALKQAEAGAMPIAGAAQPAAPAAIAEATQPADAALTPLEQAVHDIMAALPQPKTEPDHEDEREPVTDDDTGKTTPAAATPMPAVAVASVDKSDAPTAKPIAPPAPIAEPRVTELPQAQSHMHLVVGDDDARVVVTVAVRGDNVNVTLRGGDDQTAANLARNAGSLDHAMRAHGLDLSSFSSEPDLDHHARHDRPDREPEREAAEPFVVEEST